MPAKNALTGKDVIAATTSAAADTASVVTVAAPAGPVQNTLYITGIILSASGTIGAAVAVTLSGVVGGTITFRLPASAIAPMVIMFGTHPLKITPAVNAVLTLPALGAAIVGTATLLYYVDTV